MFSWFGFDSQRADIFAFFFFFLSVIVVVVVVMNEVMGVMKSSSGKEEG